jgi:hypothetical protein
VLLLAEVNIDGLKTRERPMSFLKKEWKAVFMVIWLIVIAIYLSKINGHLEAIHAQNEKTISTIDSIESVAISTDAALVDFTKNIKSVDAKLLAIAKRLKRR